MPLTPESLDFLLAQVSRLHHTRAHTLFESLGLYRGQPPVLHALWDQDGLTHSELAERLHVTPATMTRMIQRMEKAGFVTRRPDEQDQRVSRVHLTKAGRAIRAKLQAVWQTMESETFAGLTPAEQVELRQLLLKIRANLLDATGGTRPF